MFQPLPPKPPRTGDVDGLRYYQREAYDSILNELTSVRSTMAVMATGLGKTRLFAAVIKHWEGRVLVLVHRSELLTQAVADIRRITGEQVSIEQATLFGDKSARIVVASVDTIKLKSRLERWSPNHFSLIVPDEFHHYVSKTYRRPLDHFTGAKVFGVTATADRADKKAMGQIVDTVAFKMDIRAGIKAGYLVPIKGRFVHIDKVDLTNVKTVAGDLNRSQLDEVMLAAVESIVDKTIELEPDRQAICFFPGVQSAQYAAERFNARIPGSALFISGKTDQDERRENIQKFKAGDFRYLCNCEIATEGFDAPEVSMVVMGRPTKSRPLYTQMAGRATRVLPYTVDNLYGKGRAQQRREAIAASGKPDMVLLDFVGNAGKHSLISPVDLLGEDYTVEEKEHAKKVVEEKPEVEIQEALDFSRLELRRIANQLEAMVQARIEDFNPFELMHVKESEAVDFSHKAASPQQIRMLRGHGVEERHLKNMSMQDAKALAGKLWMRHQQGWASLNQARVLAAHGVDAKGVKTARANNGVKYVQRCEKAGAAVSQTTLRRLCGL